MQDEVPDASGIAGNVLRDSTLTNPQFFPVDDGKQLYPVLWRDKTKDAAGDVM